MSNLLGIKKEGRSLQPSGMVSVEPGGLRARSPEHLRFCPCSGFGPGRCLGCGRALTAARLPRGRRPGGAIPPPAPRRAAAASAARSAPPQSRSVRVPAAAEGESVSVTRMPPPPADRGRQRAAGVRHPRASARPSAKVCSRSHSAGRPWDPQSPSAHATCLTYRAGPRQVPRLQSLQSPSLQSRPIRSPGKAPPRP